MVVILYPPDRRKRDVDNVLKPILDAFEHADVYTNDVVITSLTVKKQPFQGKDNARAEVFITQDLEYGNI